MTAPKADWSRWIAAELGAIRRRGQWRQPRVFDAHGPEGWLDSDGPRHPVVSFASNDYLGLSAHPSVEAAARQAVDRWGTGATASRLVVGTRPVHAELEGALARWKGTERAVLFPTGYAANLAALSAFGGPEVRICSDELNHASIIDGCRLSRSEVAVFRHGDLEHLAELLGQRGSWKRQIVVTDTVFSMDGDTADVEGLMAVAGRAGALLVLDEAHAVLGPHLDARLDGDATVVRVGTLSKALGSVGGFVAARADVAALLENRARPYIFSTGLPPAAAAAALAALAVVRSAEGEALVSRLRQLAERVAPAHPSPIVPVIVGSEEAAVAASESLLDRGLWVPAIRPPTVPPGTSRLRIALSAAHTDDHVDRLLDALAPWRGAGGCDQ